MSAGVADMDANILVRDARNGLIVQFDAMNVIRCSRRREPSRECTAVATSVSLVLAGRAVSRLSERTRGKWR